VHSRNRRVSVGLTLLALCGAPFPLAAQPRDAAAAEALFRQGREASEAGDHRTACEKFKESNRLDPAVGTVFNIADCEEKLGRLATAWTLFQEVAQRLPTNDDRHAIAKSRASALEPRLPRLTVKLGGDVPPGTLVERDGVELGAASLDTALPVDPGPHSVRVSAPGRKAGVFRVVLRESEVRTLDVEAGPALDSPGGEPAGGGTPEPSSSGTRTLGYVLGGIGIAGLGVGVVTGVMVLDRKSTADDNCPEKRCNQQGFDAAESGRTLGVVSTAGFVVGAVGLAAGAYLVLKSKPEQASRTVLFASARPSGAAFSVLHAF
jgi:hypothetical protein